MKHSTLKRSIRIGVTGEAEKEVQVGCNHNPEDLLLVAAIFNGVPACIQATNEQKISVGIETGGQLVVFVGKAVEFRLAFGKLSQNGNHHRRKGYVDPTAKAKAALAAESVYTSVGWKPGDPIPAMA